MFGRMLKLLTKHAKPEASFDTLVEVLGEGGAVIDVVATRVDVVKGLAVAQASYANPLAVTYRILSSIEISPETGLPV